MPDQTQADRSQEEGGVTMKLRIAETFLAAVIAQATMLSVPAAAQEPPPTLADLPAAIKPDAGLAIYRSAFAVGAQIYTCSKNDAGTWAWTLKAPEAILVGPQEKALGKHYAGPSWEGLDGGKVVGAAKASAPSPDQSIPWLLLDIKSREGNGEFTQAKAIVRARTKGGVAPAQGCDAGHAGTEQRVHYTAFYLFLK
jgi:hypothetical protein